MPPQRALASLGFVAPAVLPLPSAAPGQDNPGAVTSHGSCSWAPREPQLRLGRDRRADAGQGLSPVVAPLCGGCRWLLSGAQGTRAEPLRPLWAGNRSSKFHLQGALGVPRLLSFLETAPCRGSCSHCRRDVAPAEINTEINSGTPAGDPSLPRCHGPAHQGTNASQVSPAPAERQRIQLWPLSLSGGAPLQPWQSIYG